MEELKRTVKDQLKEATKEDAEDRVETSNRVEDKKFQQREWKDQLKHQRNMTKGVLLRK